MNLQSKVSERLWAAIEQSYEAGNFKNAVLDGMHAVTEILREKSGLDGDGHQLVGQSLGGEAPKIRLNSLQTESEKNFQRGIEQILRGMYMAIRNTRSHELASDGRQTADSILLFVNYLLTVLLASSEAYTVDTFLERIRDADFVNSERYAELMAAEIPPLRYGDAMIAVFEHRRSIAISKRDYLIEKLISVLSEPQLNIFLARVSAAFRVVKEDADIRTALELIKPEHWCRLEEAARIRIEHKLINSIKEGDSISENKVRGGALGTWASSFLPHFSTKGLAISTLIAKFRSTVPDQRHYAARFFLRHLPSIDDSEFYVDRCVRAIADAVRSGDEVVKSELLDEVLSFPDKWISKLVKTLGDLTDPNNPAVRLKDGTPFLTATPEAKGKALEFDDDIPF